MPIGAFEREILRLIAANRNPESFDGGSTVMLQEPESTRQSEDIDLFHDTRASLDDAVERDTKSLADAGYSFEITRRQTTFCHASVTRENQLTKLEWVFDSAFRFFPVEPDLDLGWRLNFWDAATNKVLAFAGRTALRDYLDVLYLHERHLHLGALAWAAAGKDPGLTPEMIVEGARRNTRFPGEDLSKLHLAQPIDFKAMKGTFLQAAEEAEAIFKQLPMTEMGCFYLDAATNPVCPDPNSPDFAKLTRHFGCVKGAWPRIVDES
jgi:hypothetical protein